MDSTKSTIASLKFIGHINKNEKIDVKNMTIQSDNMWTKFWRFFYKDNRSNTLGFVIQTINNSFDILNEYVLSQKDYDKIALKKLVSDIKQAKIGIINLKETYEKYDIKFCCNLQTIIEDMESRLLNFKEDGSFAISHEEVLPFEKKKK